MAKTGQTTIGHAEDLQPPRRNYSSDPPKLREARFGDYEEVAAVEARNGLQPRSREDWLALWTGNPAYEALGNGWPIGWVLEARSGRIVGSIGNIPLQYRFMGRTYQAATACGWAVDADYRGFSMLLLARFVKQSNVDFFICTTINESSENCYRAFGWSKAPVGDWDGVSFWVTGCLGFAKSALRNKAIPFAGIFAYPASVPIYWLNRIRGGPRARHGTHSGAGHRGIEQIETAFDSQFDGRFEEFWNELLHRNAMVYLADRSRPALVWHFRTRLARKTAWIVTACKGSKLIAYAVFERRDNAALGLVRIRLVDFQAIASREDALNSILGAALRQCRETGIHVLEAPGCGQGRAEFGGISAPYHRSLAVWSHYYKANDETLDKALKDPAVWAPSLFDGDASL